MKKRQNIEAECGHSALNDFCKCSQISPNINQNFNVRYVFTGSAGSCTPNDTEWTQEEQFLPSCETFSRFQQSYYNASEENQEYSPEYFLRKFSEKWSDI